MMIAIPRSLIHHQKQKQQHVRLFSTVRSHRGTGNDRYRYRYLSTPHAPTRTVTSSSTTSTTIPLEQSKPLVTWDVQPIPGRHNNRFVGTLTLQSDNPSTLNALTMEMGVQFQALVRSLTHDIVTGVQHVDVIVLQGAGDRAFSAGGDLSWLRSLQDNSVHANVDRMMQFYHYFLTVRSLPVPVIAAIHGPAMGAGAGLALACDLRTINQNHPALLGLHFTRLGIHAGMGSSHYLPQVASAGRGIVNEILLTGKILSGSECIAYGLANGIDNQTNGTTGKSDTDNDTIDAKEKAYNLARNIVLHQHPVALRTMVRTLRQQQDVGLEQALQREAMAQAVCYKRGDWGEGINAIAAKRDPIFDSYHAT